MILDTTLNISGVDSQQLKRTSLEYPKILLGWQVLVLKPDPAHKHQRGLDVLKSESGAFNHPIVSNRGWEFEQSDESSINPYSAVRVAVITGVAVRSMGGKSNSAQQTAVFYRLSSLLYADEWVLLNRADEKIRSRNVGCGLDRHHISAAEAAARNASNTGGGAIDKMVNFKLTRRVFEVTESNSLVGGTKYAFKKL